jgi:hypothetical protein
MQLRTKLNIGPAELAAATVEQCFADVDTNGDGLVSVDEFVRWAAVPHFTQGPLLPPHPGMHPYYPHAIPAPPPLPASVPSRGQPAAAAAAAAAAGAAAVPFSLATVMRLTTLGVKSVQEVAPRFLAAVNPRNGTIGM